jgi:hypothetical protein
MPFLDADRQPIRSNQIKSAHQPPCSRAPLPGASGSLSPSRNPLLRLAPPSLVRRAAGSGTSPLAWPLKTAGIRGGKFAPRRAPRRATPAALGAPARVRAGRQPVADALADRPPQPPSPLPVAKRKVISPGASPTYPGLYSPRRGESNNSCFSCKLSGLLLEPSQQGTKLSKVLVNLAIRSN